MREIVVSNQFKKDLKLAKKRGLDFALLERVVDMLVEGKKLPAQYHDHGLSGDYVGFRECHMESDWLLIYRVDDRLLELFLFRTGTHSDLF